MPRDPAPNDQDPFLVPIEDVDPIDPEARVRGRHIAPVRQRTRDSRLAAASAFMVLLVALAIVKPWGVAAPAPSRSPRPFTLPPATVLPVPTRDRSPEGLAGPICLGAGAWRVASLERWRTSDVRVWRAVEPIADAADPLDPRIPTAPVVALEVTALGWCAPAYGEHRPTGPASVRAWTVRADVATALPLVQTQPSEGVTPIAALYLPTASCTVPGNCTSSAAPGLLGRWASGRVVFRWIDEGRGTQAWFAADIVILPDGGPGTSEPPMP